MARPTKSRRGVYYDLNKSPYEYTNSYGDSFKFPSQKKLEVYTAGIVKEIERVTKLISRNELWDFIPTEIVQLIYRETYRAYYRKVVK